MVASVGNPFYCDMISNRMRRNPKSSLNAGKILIVMTKKEGCETIIVECNRYLSRLLGWARAFSWASLVGDCVADFSGCFTNHSCPNERSAKDPKRVFVEVPVIQTR